MRGFWVSGYGHDLVDYNDVFIAWFPLGQFLIVFVARRDH